MRTSRTPRSASPRSASALAVLQGASTVLQRGWLQHAEREIRADDGRLTARGPGQLLRTCLVAAVVEAAHWHDDDPSVSGPALDALWLALRDRHRGGDAVGPVPSPAVRELRARDLARWNDAPERTRDDVLALVENALARVRADLVRSGALVPEPAAS